MLKKEAMLRAFERARPLAFPPATFASATIAAAAVSPCALVASSANSTNWINWLKRGPVGPPT